MKTTNLGEFEELVLLTVGLLEQEAYGISIKEEIEKRSGRKPSIGALHTALTRLEEKGFVQSVLEDSTASRRGRRKRYYRITGAGKKALVQTYELRSSLIKLIPNLLGS